jgi:hypothetical protein
MDINCVYATQASTSCKIPIISGILYNDGTIDSLAIVEDDADLRRIEKGSKTNIDSFVDTVGNAFYSHASVVFRTEDSNRKIAVSCGEGANRNEGFISVESLENDSVVWLASFNNSSPFERVEIIGNTIYGVNNIGEIWAFAINDPSSASIVKNIWRH